MIVITGASDGLGKHLAKLYKKSGTKVANVSRNKSEFADINILANLREGDEIKKAAQELIKNNDTIDAIVYCAGVMSLQPLGEIEESEIKRLMATNVKSQILLTSNLIDKIKNDQTDIVCVSSTVGTKAYKDQAVYGASKWAVRGFAKNLQEEFKGEPNRVISFCPGGFQSRIFEKATGNKLENLEDWMKPEDIAVLIKQILDLPKNMEVSEIILNRKVIANGN